MNSVYNIKNGKSIKEKYWDHKTSAKRRGIEFTLTLDEWWNIWHQSGKWLERGRKKGQYVMSRIGDKGGYTLDNVIIQTNANNNRDAAPNRIYTKESFENRIPWNKGKKIKPLSQEHKNKISLSTKGISKPQSKKTCPHCGLIGGASNMTRKHFDNCKHKELMNG